MSSGKETCWHASMIVIKNCAFINAWIIAQGLRCTWSVGEVRRNIITQGESSKISSCAREFLPDEFQRLTFALSRVTIVSIRNGSLRTIVNVIPRGNGSRMKCCAFQAWSPDSAKEIARYARVEARLRGRPRILAIGWIILVIRIVVLERSRCVIAARRKNALIRNASIKRGKSKRIIKMELTRARWAFHRGSTCQACRRIADPSYSPQCLKTKEDSMSTI